MPGCLQALLGGPEHQPASTAPSAWCGSACLAPSVTQYLPHFRLFKCCRNDPLEAAPRSDWQVGLLRIGFLAKPSAVQIGVSSPWSQVTMTCCHCRRAVRLFASEMSATGLAYSTVCIKHWPAPGRTSHGFSLDLQPPMPAAGAHGRSGDGGNRTHLRSSVHRALAGPGQPDLPGHGHAPAPPGAHAQLCAPQRHPGTRPACCQCSSAPCAHLMRKLNASSASAWL